MKAQRPDGGYVFHGGCDGCTQPLSVCPTCCYMKPDWNLPDRNPISIKEEKEKQAMMELANITMKTMGEKTNL